MEKKESPATERIKQLEVELDKVKTSREVALVSRTRKFLSRSKLSFCLDKNLPGEVSEVLGGPTKESQVQDGRCPERLVDMEGRFKSA